MTWDLFLQIGIFPAGALLAAIWALYLNRLTPEQSKQAEEEVLSEARASLHDLEARLERLERMQAKRSVARVYLASPNHGVRTRPETRAALTRLAPSH